jgi:hypothetical protein
VRIDAESPLHSGSASSRCYDAIVEWFAANDWKEWKVSTHDRHDRQWFKKYPGEPMCKTNEPKPLQLRAMLWDHRKSGADHVGLELELHAEPVKDDGWIIIKAHAFDSVDQVPQQIERMLKAWRAVCSSS